HVGLEPARRDAVAIQTVEFSTPLSRLTVNGPFARDNDRKLLFPCICFTLKEGSEVDFVSMNVPRHLRVGEAEKERSEADRKSVEDRSLARTISAGEQIEPLRQFKPARR